MNCIIFIECNAYVVKLHAKCDGSKQFVNCMIHICGICESYDPYAVKAIIGNWIDLLEMGFKFMIQACQFH